VALLTLGIVEFNDATGGGDFISLPNIVRNAVAVVEVLFGLMVVTIVGAFVNATGIIVVRNVVEVVEVVLGFVVGTTVGAFVNATGTDVVGDVVDVQLVSSVVKDCCPERMQHISSIVTKSY
jgi:hypothetical protein